MTVALAALDKRLGAADAALGDLDKKLTGASVALAAANKTAATLQGAVSEAGVRATVHKTGRTTAPRRSKAPSPFCAPT